MRKIIVIVILLAEGLLAQSFGQNKVQYKDFDWSLISAPNFDVYFYGDDTHLAEFTAKVAEDAHEQISKHLRWTLKKRVSIIVYYSHNDFQQTNVIWQYMQEGIGGVTELFKNRVVLPFEGDYEQFRHVIHHELVHALLNDMIYDGNIQSIIAGRVKLRIPLWVNEGLAEYLSMNWETKADMTMRDLSINEKMPTVKELEFYMAYKGGQSVWRFIAEKYGREKIGEIINAMKMTQNAEKGFERALGMDYEDLTKQWHKYLKKEYWPDVAGRDEIEDIAKRLTDHKEAKNYYNISPAVSPDGSKIAVLSDRSGYFDIYLLDAIDGEEIRRLVKGNRSVDFEELKLLQPGISWSPDSKRIAIAAKAGKTDALYLIDVKTRKKEKLTFNLDGIFTAAWSPDGNELAFIGTKAGASDIYVYNLETEKLTPLTDDIYSDSEPAWNNDGTALVFVSDRKDDLTGEYEPESIEMETFSQKDLYTIEVKSKTINRLTATDYNEDYPIWPHTETNTLFYVSDKGGVWNIYRHNLDTEPVALTNILTGAFQLSLTDDDGYLIFSGYADMGWDVYSMSLPLDKEAMDVPVTRYIMKQDEVSEDLTDLRRHKRGRWSSGRTSGRDYQDWIFAREYDHYNKSIETPEDASEDFVTDTTDLSENGYIPKVYKTRFTLDLVNGYASYNNLFGAQGMTMFAFSDILGDHQIYFGTEMVIDLKRSDYFFSYAYLTRPTDYYFSISHIANEYFLGYDINGYQHRGLLRNLSLIGYVSRPFSRFMRIEGGLSYNYFSFSEWQQVNYYEFEEVSTNDFSVILPVTSWVYDNTVYGYTGPIDGFRQNTTLAVSPGWGNKKLDFKTLKMDFRKYFKIGRYSSLAGRLTLGTSRGADKQKFYLGGLQNWIFGTGETNGVEDDSRSRNDILDGENDLFDVFFSEFVMPVRGRRYMESVGSNVALANIEFRFPFLLAVGVPNKFMLSNLGSHIFLDVGTAWDKSDDFSNNQIAGFGWGMKINLGYFLLRIDSAWDINESGYSKPQYYFSLGTDW
ncbi:MAG: PD40 domain-containing protein [Candidatus Marinimicrobia bacterium]|nr:PD40 domain-containing protein [Candidatus Neomarinimicrobiota bacterium]